MSERKAFSKCPYVELQEYLQANPDPSSGISLWVYSGTRVSSYTSLVVLGHSSVCPNHNAAPLWVGVDPREKVVGGQVNHWEVLPTPPL